MEANKDAVRLVKPYVEQFIKGKGATLPSTADCIGQMFLKTGTSAGLYVATGTSTPGWKAVSHA